MTVVAERPLQTWLHRETPLGVPAFTPIRVRHLSENCYFEIDGIIVRMVFLGGLSGYDEPSASAWTLRATPTAELSGIEFSTGWQAQTVKNMLESEPSESEFASHRAALATIEQVTGFSRRELKRWLKTSHTTLNGIANSDRNPRNALAVRIVNFSRLTVRLQAIFGDDRETIRRALTTETQEEQSALSLVLQGDYQLAATAAQYAIYPRRKLKPIRGESYMDSPMVAIENI